MTYRDVVSLPASLGAFVEGAIVRLRGLHPEVQVTIRGAEVSIEAENLTAAQAAAGALLHLLYQERIYDEGRDIRRALFAKLLGA